MRQFIRQKTGQEHRNRRRSRLSGLCMAAAVLLLLTGCTGGVLQEAAGDAASAAYEAGKESLEESKDDLIEQVQDTAGNVVDQALDQAAEAGQNALDQAAQAGQDALGQAQEALDSSDLPDQALDTAQGIIDSLGEALEGVSGKEQEGSGDAEPLDPDGSYTTKEDVSLYLLTYGKLPGNFITKKEARDLGWSGGSLEPYAPGKCIGGDVFGNYEELLPEKKGRTYHECDIDTLGKKSRGAKRLVYSDDGLIYYTDDHYDSFTLLYGEEEDGKGD